MNAVAALQDRESILSAKRAELSGVVASRKRKLRSLYAVASDAWETINNDEPSQAEARFLDDCDVLRNKPFDENLLPMKWLRRRDNAKTVSTLYHKYPEPQKSDALLKTTTVHFDGGKGGTIRAPSPTAKSEGGRGPVSTKPTIDPKPPEDIPMPDADAQNEVVPTAKNTLNEIVGEALDYATDGRSPRLSDETPSGQLQDTRIHAMVGNRPGSPGLDPREASPVTAAALPEPILSGLVNEHQKTATVHLPLMEVQEQQLSETSKMHEMTENHASQLSIDLPGTDRIRTTEVLSSPGSTAVFSATTPALHDASTDTSPEESSLSEPDKFDGKAESNVSVQDASRKRDDAAYDAENAQSRELKVDVSQGITRGNGITVVDHDYDKATSSFPSRYAEATGLDIDIDGMNLQEKPYEHKAQDTKVSEDDVTDEVKVALRSARIEERDVSLPDLHLEALNQHPRTKEKPASRRESQTSAASAEPGANIALDSFESIESKNIAAAQSEAKPEDTELPTESNKSSRVASSDIATPCGACVSNEAPPVEHMTTRVSSGAIRHESASEILGEIPGPNTSKSNQSPTIQGGTESEPTSSLSAIATSGSSDHHNPIVSERPRENEKSRLSTVVFAKQLKPVSDGKERNSDDEEPFSNDSSLSTETSKDYFMPLFLASASTERRGIQPLDNLLLNAHKTISTSNAYVPIHESQTTRILKRIYALQNSNKWSLRQPKRSKEPARPTTQWDLFLQEAKWMRTDFREERKWKITVARNLAFACAEWIAASSDDRKLLQVVVASPLPAAAVVHDGSDVLDIPLSTPELIASGENDSPTDEFEDEPHPYLGSVAPTAIFALQDDDVVFSLRRSPTSDKLLNELPMYGQPLFVPQCVLPTSKVDPDRFWKRLALPLSKFVEGRIEITIAEPPRKKSRFEYEDEDEDNDEEHMVFGELKATRTYLPPEQTNVALFNPENQHIRDRIHSAHHFRPPSEYAMPLQSFFECRVASQWTWAEDNELRNLVREYTYNWSLIASMLCTQSLFSSGAERRTPWECFERWIHLEGLPADMQKTHYFRHYNSRIEAAQRALMVAAAQVAQAPNANGQVQPRRRNTTSIRVERRRNQKHLSMVEAMRKSSKKRETALQKQQHVANLAQMRKAQEAPPPKNAVHTPQDFSKLKHEREEQARERMLMQQQRQEAHRRASLMQHRISQSQGSMSVNGTPARPNVVNGIPNGQSQNGHNLAVSSQNRPRAAMSMSQSPLTNGLQVPMGVPQAPMVRGIGPMPVSGNPAVDLQLLQQAHQIHQLQQQQTQQQGQNCQMYGSPPRVSGMSRPSYPNNVMQPPPVYNQNQSPNAVSTPPSSYSIPMQRSPSHGSQGSPPLLGPPSLPSTVPVPLEAQIRQKNPGLSDAEVLQFYHAALKAGSFRQTAMSAAAGNGTPRLNPSMHVPNGDGGAMSPQMYAQMMIAQQRQQAPLMSGASVPSNGGGVNGNGNGTGSHGHERSSESEGMAQN